MTYDLCSLEIIFLQKKNVIFLNSASVELLLWGFCMLVSRLTHGHIIRRARVSIWALLLFFKSCVTLRNDTTSCFFTYSFAAHLISFSVWSHKRWGAQLLLAIQIPCYRFFVFHILRWIQMTSVLQEVFHKPMFP